ncbi:hypothetical protein IU486_30845 [Streptomyces gardneri]|uniref:hypothetical protein n=1 Tax=Nocardia TaxID=1817 RepID=UPI001357D100|nr:MULTISPECIES: hypothetical protein [Nocardia]MBF6169106.1 hypothetical protein [Streptomyces gardneri]MBF6207308.1 hypothetical protein [Streptomyces gardneri]
MTDTARMNGSIQPSADDHRIGTHLVTATLDAVDETVTELLETAEHHKTVAPEISLQMVVLANTIMQETVHWLRQVTRA